MDINQIVEMLKQVSDAVSKLKIESENENNLIDEGKKLAKIAGKFPISKHILDSKDELIRYGYIASLISLFADKGNDIVKRQRMLYIYRIIAAYDKDVEITEYITRSLKVDSEFWDRFLGVLDSETAFCFAVDVLILGMLDTNSSKRNKYDEISDILQVLGLDKTRINKAARVSRAVMEQDFDQMISQIDSSDNINYSNFLGYYENMVFTNIANNIDDGSIYAGKVLIANAKVSNREEIINLDEWAADEICFNGCMFEHIRGIKADNKTISFERCTFDGNIIHTTTRTGILGGIYTEFEEDYVFITGSNLKFIKSRFVNCNVSKRLLGLSNSEITECEFTDCQGQKMPCTYVIYLSTGRMIWEILRLCHADSEGCQLKNIRLQI